MINNKQNTVLPHATHNNKENLAFCQPASRLQIYLCTWGKLSLKGLDHQIVDFKNAPLLAYHQCHLLCGKGEEISRNNIY
jgi:hypothetical protein